jgi:hypothetical protein
MCLESDIYAVGVIAYEMLAQLPLMLPLNKQLLQKRCGEDWTKGWEEFITSATSAIPSTRRSVAYWLTTDIPIFREAKELIRRKAKLFEGEHAPFPGADLFVWADMEEVAKYKSTSFNLQCYLSSVVVAYLCLNACRGSSVSKLHQARVLQQACSRLGARHHELLREAF